MNTLRQWLDEAWSRHDTASADVARELLDRAPALPDDDNGAEAVRLARHTMVGHLADPARLASFLRAAPRGARLDVQRERAQWVLNVYAGLPPAPLSEDVAWALRGEVLQAQVVQGHLAAARATLFEAEETASRHPDENARRAYASTCNNLALALRMGPRDAARDALMLDVAALSRRAWLRAGTWMHAERADYQLAMCHAAVGRGAQAVHYAQACLARCEAEGADAAERFFAHECNVHAQRAAGDMQWADAHRGRMAALLAQIDDAGMQAWCAKTLADTPG